MKQELSPLGDHFKSGKKKKRKRKKWQSIYLLLGLPLSALVVAGPAGGVHLQFNALLGLFPHRQGHVDGTGHRRLFLHGRLTRRSVLFDAQLNEKGT